MFLPTSYIFFLLLHLSRHCQSAPLQFDKDMFHHYLEIGLSLYNQENIQHYKICIWYPHFVVQGQSRLEVTNHISCGRLRRQPMLLKSHYLIDLGRMQYNDRCERSCHSDY